MPKIKEIKIEKILGFRGSETIQASVIDDLGNHSEAMVAFGKSEGKYEAKYLPADKAILKSHDLTVLLSGTDILDQEVIDRKMIVADETFQKENLGGNVMLSVSFACLRLGASFLKLPLYGRVSKLYSEKTDFLYQPPKILFNIIEGGVHAENKLPIQEHLLISGQQKVSDQIRELDFVFDNLSTILKQQGREVKYGDEGGFDVDFKSEDQVMAEIDKVVLPGMTFGFDAAANNINGFDPEFYSKEYLRLSSGMPLIYLEDPYPEEGFTPYWQNLFSESQGKFLVVGDDLTVTNPKKVAEIKDLKMINGMIVKPDQVGTFSEALESVKLAKSLGWKIAVSHRSQETTDDYLADFAIGVMADFVKFGAFYQGERLAKHNRLLEIETELGF